MPDTPRPRAHPERRRARWGALLLAVALAAPSMPALALPGDTSQPIEIDADRTEFDNQRQQHVLSGNVRVRQGSLRIEADTITLQMANGEIASVDARGKPLRFRITDRDGIPLEASARQVLYRPTEAKLSLLGAAQLTRPDRELSGERIDYALDSARIEASSGEGQRVRIVIQPPAAKQ